MNPEIEFKVEAFRLLTDYVETGHQAIIENYISRMASSDRRVCIISLLFSIVLLKFVLMPSYREFIAVFALVVSVTILAISAESLVQYKYHAVQQVENDIESGIFKLYVEKNGIDILEEK